CSSSQASSTSSCSGLKPTAPRTPIPPALVTAATTSRQWLKAKIGNSIPSWSQIGVRITVPPWWVGRSGRVGEHDGRGGLGRLADALGAALVPQQELLQEQGEQLAGDDGGDVRRRRPRPVGAQLGEQLPQPGADRLLEQAGQAPGLGEGDGVVAQA